jgi:hypothetical protein
LKDKSEEPVQAIFPIEFDAIGGVSHVASCDEDRLMLTHTALFPDLASLPANGLLSEALHIPDPVLGLLSCEELLLVPAKAAAAIQVAIPQLALANIAQGHLGLTDGACHKVDCVETEFTLRATILSRGMGGYVSVFHVVDSEMLPDALRATLQETLSRW